jgi:hypothetical protein
MKRTILAIFLLFPLVGFSQLVMTYESHGLKPGTINSMQATSYMAPGEGGAKKIWDFSSSTPIAGQDGANEVISSNDRYHTLVTGISGAKFSYLCNKEANIYDGYQYENYTLIYNQPIRKIVYPFSYGSSISGSFDARYVYDNGKMSSLSSADIVNTYEYGNNSLEGKMVGTYSSEADAHGTLILPGGQVLNDVLRVKTVEKYVQELCSNVEVETVKYLWYISEHRYPVFVTWDIHSTDPNGQEVSNSQASFYTLADIHQTPDTPVYTTLTDENEADTENVEVNYQIYPNPYNAYFHVTYTLDKPTNVTISLYSLSGNLVSHIVDNRIQNGVQHVTYNTSGNEITGVYYLRLQFGEKLYVRALVKE